MLGSFFTFFFVAAFPTFFVTFLLTDFLLRAFVSVGSLEVVAGGLPRFLLFVPPVATALATAAVVFRRLALG